MPAAIDALTSPTLRHLRTRWWNDEFTEFLTETLRPRPGNRILDVGCGPGTGEVSIGRLHVSQLRLVGIDIRVDKAIAARRETEAHNQRAGFAAGDARRLPFRPAVFDSTYCVAVLQHVRDVAAAVAEFARVTVPGGRVLVVEPDNAARSFYSSVPAGKRAFVMAGRFFSALLGRHERGDAALGPKLPGLLATHGIEPIDVRLFPVTHTRLGIPPDEVWRERRACIEQLVNRSRRERVQAIGRDYLAALEAYRAEAAQSGPSFVEIQNTMLFATVGQRSA